MIRIDYFNKLPAREEHLSALRAVFKKNEKLQLKTLIRRSGLTKTQTLCALQALALSGKIEIEEHNHIKLYSPKI